MIIDICGGCDAVTDAERICVECLSPVCARCAVCDDDGELFHADCLATLDTRDQGPDNIVLTTGPR